MKATTNTRTATTRNRVIEELHSTRFVENYAARYMGEADRQNKADIVQELYLMVCEIAPDRLLKMYDDGQINAVRRFVAGLVVRQMRSENSTVYKKYTRRIYRELPTASTGGFANIADDVDLWQRTTAIRSTAAAREEGEE